MTLRQAVDLVMQDGDWLEGAFVIAAFLRTAAQGEPSTYEGECASINKAIDILPFDVKSPEGIQLWLAHIGELADKDMPDKWWKQIAETADEEDGR